MIRAERRHNRPSPPSSGSSGGRKALPPPRTAPSREALSEGEPAALARLLPASKSLRRNRPRPSGRRCFEETPLAFGMPAARCVTAAGEAQLGPSSRRDSRASEARRGQPLRGGGEADRGSQGQAAASQGRPASRASASPLGRAGRREAEARGALILPPRHALPGAPGAFPPVRAREGDREEAGGGYLAPPCSAAS